MYEEIYRNLYAAVVPPSYVLHMYVLMCSHLHFRVPEVVEAHQLHSLIAAVLFTKFAGEGTELPEFRIARHPLAPSVTLNGTSVCTCCPMTMHHYFFRINT